MHTQGWQLSPGQWADKGRPWCTQAREGWGVDTSGHSQDRKHGGLWRKPIQVPLG